MKFSVEQIEETLLQRKIDIAKVNDIIKDLVQVAEEEKQDKVSGGPKAKWQHIVVLNDPEGKFTGQELTAWVLVQQDGQDAALILSKLTDAASQQNDAAKRKKNKLTTFGDIFQSLKPKFLKEKGLKIKTKSSVRVLIVNGKSM